MLRLFVAFFCFSFGFFLSEKNFAQGTNSPYSRAGLGDLLRPNTVNTFAAGGTGIALGSMTHINLLNPALLPMNRFTSFEAAAFAEHKVLSDSKNRQKDTGGNIGYLALLFPFTRTSSMVIGMQPYSSVKYETSFFRRIEGAPSFARYTYTGEGGLTQAFLGYGTKIWKEFYAGGRINYNFGATKHVAQSVIFDSNDPTGEYIAEIWERVNYSDFSFQGGLFYRFMLNNKKTKSLNIGVTYDAAANMRGYEKLLVSRKKIDGAGIAEDTLRNDLPTQISVPAGFGFGISLQKALHYGIGLDVFVQDWSKFKNNGQIVNTLGKHKRISIGGEYTPDPTSIDSYFNRVTYRAGISYSESPVVINGENLKEYGIRTGMSMPFGRFFSSFNIAIAAGMRQSASSSQTKENFYQLQVSGTINDRWFIRRKYD
jgi:hypothetical protein